jgi:hypothetical protein
VRHALERGFARIEYTVHEQGLVSTGAQPGIEQRDVSRRASDIEARDNAQNLHGRASLYLAPPGLYATSVAPPGGVPGPYAKIRRALRLPGDPLLSAR